MNNTQRGMAYFVASFFVAALVDAPAKYLLAQGLPQATVMFLRFGITILLMVLVLWHKGAGFKTSKHPKLNFTRGVLLALSNLVFLLALKYLSLSVAASIVFASPLIACALAHIFLGERVGLRRWLAVIAGFIGVLIVMRPGTASFHPAMLAALFNAFLIAIYQILTRRVGHDDEPIIGLIWVFAVPMAVATLWVPFQWQTPELAHWPFIIVMGVSGLGTHYLVSRALQYSEASVLAPLMYTQIFWMIGFGIVLFGDWPDQATLLGTGIIIASGIYVWHRARSKFQPAET